MNLIIGLGNPGKEYEFNRHNVGYLFLDYLLSNKLETPSDLKEFKTEGVFMNESGKFVVDKVNFFKIDLQKLFIVHDDLDIPFGQFKIQLGVGPKVHNGLSSIEESLKSKEFYRVRIGTDSRVRDPDQKLGESGKGFVLGDFSKEELKALNEIFPSIWEELSKLVV